MCRRWPQNPRELQALLVTSHKNQENISILSSAEKLIINQPSSKKYFPLFNCWYNVRPLSTFMCKGPAKVRFTLHDAPWSGICSGLKFCMERPCKATGQELILWLLLTLKYLEPRTPNQMIQDDRYCDCFPEGHRRDQTHFRFEEFKPKATFGGDGEGGSIEKKNYHRMQDPVPDIKCINNGKNRKFGFGKEREKELTSPKQQFTWKDALIEAALCCLSILHCFPFSGYAG